MASAEPIVVEDEDNTATESQVINEVSPAQPCRRNAAEMQEYKIWKKKYGSRFLVSALC